MNFALRVVGFPDVEFSYSSIDRQTSADDFLAFTVRALLHCAARQDRDRQQAEEELRIQREAHFGLDVSRDHRSRPTSRYWSKVSERVALVTDNGRQVEEITQQTTTTERNQSRKNSSPVSGRSVAEAFRDLDSGVVDDDPGWLHFIGTKQVLHVSYREGRVVKPIETISLKDLALLYVGDVKEHIQSKVKLHPAEMQLFVDREPRRKEGEVLPRARYGGASEGDGKDGLLHDDEPMFPHIAPTGECSVVISRREGTQIHVHVLTEDEAIAMTSVRREEFVALGAHPPSWATRRRRREKMQEYAGNHQHRSPIRREHKHHVNVLGSHPGDHRVFSFSCFPLNAPLSEVQDRLLGTFGIDVLGFCDFSATSLETLLRDGSDSAPVVNLWPISSRLLDLGEGFDDPLKHVFTMELYAVEVAQAVPASPPPPTRRSGGGPALMHSSVTRNQPEPFFSPGLQELTANVTVCATARRDEVKLELQLPVDRPYFVDELRHFLAAEGLIDDAHRARVFHGSSCIQDDEAIGNFVNVPNVHKAAIALVVRH